MSLPRVDFLFPSERLLILQDAADVTGDPSLGISVTYRHLTGRSFTPSTGAMTPTYTDTTLSAIRNVISAQQVAVSNGLYQMGDIRYLIERADLASDPGKEDQIVEGGVTYGIVSVDSDPVSAFWRVVARRLT